MIQRKGPWRSLEAVEFATLASPNDAAKHVRTQAGVEVSCYKCTAKFILTGLMLGEIDFLAGAQAKVLAMVERSRQAARRGR